MPSLTSTDVRASVGASGADKRDDVIVVQELLNENLRPPSRFLAVDGLVGPRTIGAIKTFQRGAVGMQRPDGRVDPGGPTITEGAEKGSGVFLGAA